MERQIMQVVSKARARAVKMTIRSLLSGMTLTGKMKELDSAIWMHDTIRIKCINECMDEDYNNYNYYPWSTDGNN